jgi:hypothetical protein
MSDGNEKTSGKSETNDETTYSDLPPSLKKQLQDHDRNRALGRRELLDRLDDSYSMEFENAKQEIMRTAVRLSTHSPLK